MPEATPWWEQFRDEMPIVDRWAYFDHAAVAPMSGAAQQAMTEFARDMAENGEAHWSQWRKRVEHLRRLGSKLLGCDSGEIAVVRNTTEGINLVSEGFPWRAGDNVVTLDAEFPSNRFPWLMLADRGVETRQVATDNERIDVDRIAQSCDARTRLISVSWVGYATGWRNDLDDLVAMAHQRGAYLFVDAIQGLSAFPLDVGSTPIDFLAADGHKWMLGPEGAGLFYMRAEHTQLLRPMGVGWNSVQNAGDYASRGMELKQSAARYEGGSYNLAGIAGLAASLDRLLEFGVENIADRIVQVTDELCERLTTMGAEVASCRESQRSSGIVAFTLPHGSPQELKRQCLEQGVVINCRAGRLRVSPHVYNNLADIEKLFDALTA